MHRLLDVVRAAKRKLLSAGGLLASPSPSQTQSEPHNAAAAAPVFEYEVASIKPTKSGSVSKPADTGLVVGGKRLGTVTIKTGAVMSVRGGFTATNVTTLMLIQQAYRIQNYQISGAPEWLNSLHYDMDAKIEASVADGLQKLSPEDRSLARQGMLQALLAERFKLTIQRETKELPVYSLVIGKSGLKMQKAKPANSSPAPEGMRGPDASGGRRGAVVMKTVGRGGLRTISAQAVPIANLVQMLAGAVGRPVLDKTGLTGVYDINLQWMPDANQFPAHPGGAPDGVAPPAPSDSSGPWLTTALQEQLGLNLESGNGPVEIIVIGHVEKPSEN